MLKHEPEVHWISDYGIVHVVLWPAGECVRPFGALCGEEPAADEPVGIPTVDRLCAHCLKHLLEWVEDGQGDSGEVAGCER